MMFKRTRGGVDLTKEEVREIEKGRKELRKRMRAQGIRSQKEFETTASSMGLYFDKKGMGGLLFWLFNGKALWALLGAALALLLIMFIFSLVSQRRGHFTINLGDNMFRNGFVLSEDKEFTNPTSQLYSQQVENVPCISISTIPDDVDNYDGSHNGAAYFAYTFYVRNEGEDEVGYAYELAINSESLDLSCAAWVMLFEDGEMTFYAESGEDGKVEALPSLSDDRRGYRHLPLMSVTKNQQQYQVVATTEAGTYYRLMPVQFETESIITSGQMDNVLPMDVHKYTVVLWLEGDDPDCTDELIGGHLGVEMNFRLLDSDDDAESQGKDDDMWYSLRDLWDSIWEGLAFWED